MSDPASDFFGRLSPKEEAEQQAKERIDKMQAEADRQRKILARCFTSDDGRAALAIMRELAEIRALSPMNTENADKATQQLWWREGRMSLYDEIHQIVKKETER